MTHGQRQGKINSLWHSLDNSQKDAVVGLYGNNESGINTARSHEAKRDRKDAMHEQLLGKFEQLWHSLTNSQKDAVISVIEKHKERNIDAIHATVLREYTDDLAQAHIAGAVLVYLRELSLSKQRYLLVHEAGLPEAQAQKIIDAVTSKLEESVGELMMYPDRDFFSPFD